VLSSLLEELDHRDQKANQHAQKVALIQAELAAFAGQTNFATLVCEVRTRRHARRPCLS
jgi:hypothetical protein